MRLGLGLGLGKAGGTMSGVLGAPLHPAAEAYAVARGLSSSLARKLSNYIESLEGYGFTIAQLFALRSEFLARDGSTYHAVIGNDGSVTGTVTNNASGALCAPGGYIQFANPAKSTALTDLAIFANVSTVEEPTTAINVVSGYGGASSRGPGIGIGGGPGFSSPTTTRARRSATASAWETAGNQIPSSSSRNVIAQLSVIGQKSLIGMNFRIDRILSHAGIYSQGGGGGPVSVWNDGANLRIGQRADASANTQPCEVDFVLILSNTGGANASLTLATQLSSKVIGPAVNYGISVPASKIAITAVGDSMTAVENMAYIVGIHDSPWAGACAGNNNDGGTPIARTEELFAEEMAKLVNMPGHKKFIIFRGGFNLAGGGYDFTVPASRAAYIARQMVMGATAAAAGVMPIFFAATSGHVDPATTGRDAYSDELGVACGVNGYIFYDFRINYPTEFGGAGFVLEYFDGPTDGHLSDLGKQVLTADFCASVSPINPFTQP